MNYLQPPFGIFLCYEIKKNISQSESESAKRPHGPSLSTYTSPCCYALHLVDPLCHVVVLLHFMTMSIQEDMLWGRSNMGLWVLWLKNVSKVKFAV